MGVKLSTPISKPSASHISVTGSTCEGGTTIKYRPYFMAAQRAIWLHLCFDSFRGMGSLRSISKKKHRPSCMASAQGVWVWPLSRRKIFLGVSYPSALASIWVKPSCWSFANRSWIICSCSVDVAIIASLPAGQIWFTNKDSEKMPPPPEKSEQLLVFGAQRVAISMFGCEINYPKIVMPKRVLQWVKFTKIGWAAPRLVHELIMYKLHRLYKCSKEWTWQWGLTISVGVPAFTYSMRMVRSPS